MLTTREITAMALAGCMPKRALFDQQLGTWGGMGADMAAGFVPGYNEATQGWAGAKALGRAGSELFHGNLGRAAMEGGSALLHGGAAVGAGLLDMGTFGEGSGAISAGAKALAKGTPRFLKPMGGMLARGMGRIPGMARFGESSAGKFLPHLAGNNYTMRGMAGAVGTQVGAGLLEAPGQMARAGAERTVNEGTGWLSNLPKQMMMNSGGFAGGFNPMTARPNSGLGGAMGNIGKTLGEGFASGPGRAPMDL